MHFHHERDVIYKVRVTVEEKCGYESKGGRKRHDRGFAKGKQNEIALKLKVEQRKWKMEIDRKVRSATDDVNFILFAPSRKFILALIRPGLNILSVMKNLYPVMSARDFGTSCSRPSRYPAAFS